MKECGVRTNIVTAVEIRDKDASDTKLLPDVVDTTAKNFTISEISADKGYGSVKNYKAIQRRGGVPYIAFKSIHTGRAEGLWKKMFHYFQFRRDEFLAHYHKRSNVESAWTSAFGGRAVVQRTSPERPVFDLIGKSQLEKLRLRQCHDKCSALV